MKKSAGAHPVIDRRALLEFYRDIERDVWILGGPPALASWELQRRELGMPGPDAVPCDIFLWGIGPAPSPCGTRVGGVPGLPRHVAWPKIAGRSALFICQFDFRDSRDIALVQPLDDLLFVFAKYDDSLLEGDITEFAFVWAGADESECIDAAAVPEDSPAWEHVVAWGVRHRTADVPDTRDRLAKVDPTDTARTWLLPTTWASKIGGVPFDSQNPIDMSPGVFLCQLVSIQAICDEPWPFVDHASPLRVESGAEGMYAKHHQLSIGDLGEISFYLKPDGTIAIHSACG